jgi:protocatechuate 3,4-dioxygenase beta subunit
MMNPIRRTHQHLADRTRRRALEIGATAFSAVALPLPALARVLAPVAAPAATPRLTDGPFYPVAFDREPVTSLIVGGLAPEARPLQLAGRIVDRSGRPVAGSRIEIWQCDAHQHYRHPSDGGGMAVDRGFAGFGWQAAGTDGTYRFETIRPVAYPGRTPHIHVKVKVDGRTALSSQIFMPDEAAANQRDFLWRSLGADDRPLILATLARDGASDGARFDIVLG